MASIFYVDMEKLRNIAEELVMYWDDGVSFTAIFLKENPKEKGSMGLICGCRSLYNALHDEHCITAKEADAVILDEALRED